MNVWESEKVRKMNPSDKLLFVYLAVHESVLGWQKINFDKTSIIIGLNKKTIKMMIDRFKKEKMIYQIGLFVYVKNGGRK